MNLELFTKELDEIADKINKLELEEAKDSYKSSWWMYGKYWPDKKTCLEKKVAWQNLKAIIERNVDLIKQTSLENKQQLLSKFYKKLAKVEEKIAQLEAKLVYWKDKESSGKVQLYFLIAILIILLIFFLYLIATGKILSKETGIKPK